MSENKIEKEKVTSEKNVNELTSSLPKNENVTENNEEVTVVKMSKIVINLKRVTKVTAGGRRFSFQALVIAGDGNGNVGWGTGKANEALAAIEKANNHALKNQVSIPLTKKKTLPHSVYVKFGATRLLLKPAKVGKGIIAGPVVSALATVAGIKDIYAKLFASKTRVNALWAAFKGISMLKPRYRYFKIRSGFWNKNASNTTKEGVSN